MGGCGLAKPGKGNQQQKRHMFASYTPSLTDLYLLMGDPAKAVTVLGAALAAILLFWGAVYVFVKYILPYIRNS